MSADTVYFPSGIEVLVKKAAVDQEFRTLLLERRAEAAAEIGLELSAAEAAMLRSVPAAQLEAIIARTHVPDEHRRAFLGRVAAAMLAALGASSAEGGIKGGFGSGGIRPEGAVPRGGAMADRPEEMHQPTVAERVYDILRGVFPKFAELEKKAQAWPEAAAPRPVGPDTPPGNPPDRPKRPAAEAPEAQVDGDKPKAKPAAPPVPLDTRLVEDLGATPAQRIALRKQLEKEFEITIPYGSFGQLKTVGQLIDYVEEAVQRKENAGKGQRPTGQPLPTQPRLEDQPKPTGRARPGVPQSFGIRPDPPGAFGGVRP